MALGPNLLTLGAAVVGAILRVYSTADIADIYVRLGFKNVRCRFVRPIHMGILLRLICSLVTHLGSLGIHPGVSPVARCRPTRKRHGPS